MSGEDFFSNFGESSSKETTAGGENSSSWLFGNDGGIGNAAAAYVDAGAGGDGFDLPLLKGQLFGTDGGGGNGNGDEAPLTLSQLMTDPSADFNFDLGSSLFGDAPPADKSAAAESALTEKMKSGGHKKDRERSPRGAAKSSGSGVHEGNVAGEKTTTMMTTTNVRKKSPSPSVADSGQKIFEGGNGGVRSKANLNDSFSGGRSDFYDEVEADSLSNNHNIYTNNNKRVKWSGDLTEPTKMALPKSTNANSKIAKSNSGNQFAGPTADRNGGEFGAGDAQAFGGGGDGGGGLFSRRAFTGSADRAESVVSPRSGEFNLPDFSALIPPARQREKGGPKHTAPLAAQPLIVPPMLQQRQQQQRQPQGILRQQLLQQQALPSRTGSEQQKQQQRPQQQRLPSRARGDVHRPTPSSTSSSKPPSSSTLRREDGGTAFNEDCDDVGGGGGGKEINASYHLFRPVAAAFDQIASEMRPLRDLENALDGIIEHLDDLDAKCDAKMEELLQKRKAFIDATQRVQSAFQRRVEEA